MTPGPRAAADPRLSQVQGRARVPHLTRVAGLPRLPPGLSSRGRHSHHADRRSEAALSPGPPAPRVNPHTLSASAQRALEDARAEAVRLEHDADRRRAHRPGAARGRRPGRPALFERLGLDPGRLRQRLEASGSARPAARRERGAGLHLARQTADRGGLEGGARNRRRLVGGAPAAGGAARAARSAGQDCWPRRAGPRRCGRARRAGGRIAGPRSPQTAEADPAAGTAGHRRRVATVGATERAPGSARAGFPGGSAAAGRAAQHRSGRVVHAPPVWVFFTACLGVLPLAGYMGEATEHLAHRTGPTIGGLLNATFGNAAELIIAIVALRAGLVELVKASITGSILGNLLLILGLALVAGGAAAIRAQVQSHERRHERGHALAGGRGAGVSGAVPLAPPGSRCSAVRAPHVGIRRRRSCIGTYGFSLLFTLQDPPRPLRRRAAPDGRAQCGPSGRRRGPGAGHRGSRGRVRAPGPRGHRGDRDARPVPRRSWA